MASQQINALTWNERGWLMWAHLLKSCVLALKDITNEWQKKKTSLEDCKLGLVWQAKESIRRRYELRMPSVRPWNWHSSRLETLLNFPCIPLETLTFRRSHEVSLGMHQLFTCHHHLREDVYTSIKFFVSAFLFTLPSSVLIRARSTPPFIHTMEEHGTIRSTAAY